MPDALLDIIGVVPVQLVFAYALTKMLNIRRLSLFWVLELVFVLLISSFRSSMSVEFRLAASVPPSFPYSYRREASRAGFSS